MTHKIEGETREQIAAFFPDALTLALASYMQFSKDGPDEKESKAFAARHAAAKAALAHIELLLKLAKIVDLPDTQDENHNRQIVLASMLKEAQGELDDYKERENRGK